LKKTPPNIGWVILSVENGPDGKRFPTEYPSNIKKRN